MKSGLVGKAGNVLLVPGWRGGDQAEFSTAAYLDSFRLEAGTGRLMYPPVAFEGPNHYVDLLRLPKPVALIPETIPGLWAAAETLVTHAQLVSNKHGHGHTEPLRATNGEWHIKDVEILRGGPAYGYSVYLASKGGRGMAFEKREILEVEALRVDEDSFSKMVYKVTQSAIQGSNFATELGALGIERLRKTLKLPQSALLHEIAISVAQQLHQSGLYFASIDALRVKMRRPAGSRGDGPFTIESTEAGWRMVDETGVVYEGPRRKSVARKQLLEMFELGHDDGADSLASPVATIRWGLGLARCYPALEVEIEAPWNVLNPLKSPLIDVLWNPFATISS